MKTQLQNIVLLIFLAIAAAGNVVAQDAGMSDVDIIEERHGVDSEKMLYSPGEAEVRYIPKASGIVKESVSIQVAETPIQEQKVEPVSKSNEKAPAKSKDDSILSFNFLYYIIQKYKLQDIID